MLRSAAWLVTGLTAIVTVKADFSVGGQRCTFGNPPNPPFFEDYYYAYSGIQDWHALCGGGEGTVDQDTFDRVNYDVINVNNLCGSGRLDIYPQDDGNYGVYYSGGDGTKIGWCENAYSDGVCLVAIGGCDSRMQLHCYASVC